MFFSSRSSSAAASLSPEVLQLEQQIEMMDMVFMRSMKQCSRKCIPSTYHDGELNKGEAVCAQRCLSKYFEVLELVSGKLQEMGGGVSN